MKRIFDNLLKVLLALCLTFSFVGCSDFFADEDEYPELKENTTKAESIFGELLGLDDDSTFVLKSIEVEDESVVTMKIDEATNTIVSKPKKAGETKATVIAELNDVEDVYILHVSVSETGDVKYVAYLTRKVYFYKNVDSTLEKELRYFEVGTPVTLPRKLFTRGTGWSIIGWSASYLTSVPDDGYLEGAEVTFESKTDLNLYAIWKYSGTRYTITFDANGGTGTMDPMTEQIPGVQIVLNANTFTNYPMVFAGWTTAKDSKTVEYDNKGIIIIEKNITLYAVWESQKGEYDVDNFTNTKFYYVKNVDTVGFAKPHLITAMRKCWDTVLDKTTNDSDWGSESYVKLEKVGTTTSGHRFEYAGSSKTVPTYKMTLYVDGTTENVLAKEAVIVGLGKNGVMLDMDGNHGCFLFVNAGWTVSSKANLSFDPDFAILYPTEAEVSSTLKSFK